VFETGIFEQKLRFLFNILENTDEFVKKEDLLQVLTLSMIRDNLNP
jgi:hypothetical protein